MIKFNGRNLASAILISAFSLPAFSMPIGDGDFIPLIPVNNTQAKITDQVVNQGNSIWSFQYTVHNQTPCISASDDGVCFGDGDAWLDAWALPYFNDAGISNITAPDKWSYSIETVGVANETIGWDGNAVWQTSSDPNFQGENSPFTDVEQVLFWYADEPYLEGWGQTGINPEQSLSGFGFEAGFGATKAPHQTTFNFTGTGSPRQTISGDPSFPNSPSVSGNPVSVPEPASLSLLALALAGIWTARRRTRV